MLFHLARLLSRHFLTNITDCGLVSQLGRTLAYLVSLEAVGDNLADYVCSHAITKFASCSRQHDQSIEAITGVYQLPVLQDECMYLLVYRLSIWVLLLLPSCREIRIYIVTYLHI